MVTDALTTRGNTNDHDKFQKSMLPMVAFGVGEIAGCFFIGWVVDKFGSRVAAIVNLIVMVIMTCLTLGFLA